MIKVFHAPEFINSLPDLSIFIAGTIDNGASEDWQEECIGYIKSMYEETDLVVHIYNPRRIKWDEKLRNSIEDPVFYQQVNWEINALERADRIIMNFLPGSKSPITLLELGLFADTGKLVVSCPEEFWRSGNVEVVCDRFRIPLYRNIEELLNNEL